jgi:hypothetical protein
LEAARAGHDAVPIGADDVTAAGRAQWRRKRSPVRIPKSKDKIVPFGMFFGHRAGDSTQIVPIGFFL